MTTLPPRPYSVSARYAKKRVLSAIALIALGLCGVVGASWFTKYQADKIHDDQALWASGVIGDSHVSGRETSHEFILNSYELDTEYRDDKGGSHTGKLSFDLLFTSIANGSPVVLKYDPANPEHHTVSWAVEHLGARWAFVGFMALVFGGLFGGVLLALGVKQLRTLAHARLIGERSDEVTLEVVSVKPVIVNRRHAYNVYRYRLAGKEAKQQLPANEPALFTDEKQTHLVALVSPFAPDRPWIVRVGNAPFTP